MLGATIRITHLLPVARELKHKHIMKVRTKAIVDAEQLTFENQAEMKKWTGGSTWSRPPMRAVTGIMIPTIFGDSPVAYGDYVIRDEEGNFYRLTPTEFEKKFEPA